MKLFGIVGWKNSGKTGLVERLVAEFTARGISVSTVKHAHHTFDVDQEGRDSHRHRLAGARQVLLSSRTRWALMNENRDAPEALFTQLLDKLDPVDLVLVEGFKGEPIDKIEAHRAATAQPLLAHSDARVLAVATDSSVDVSQPVFDLNDTASIADFIAAHLKLNSRQPGSDGSGDKFALPPGVDWVPVDKALAQLREAVSPVSEVENVALADLAGRVLGEDVLAARASPPAANSAVDGYGFAWDGLAEGNFTLPLVDGRAEPGLQHTGIPAGHAMRILTGAPLPSGVDTVALQEYATVSDGRVTLEKLPRKGANTRAAGEDLKPGMPVLPKGRRVTAADMALLASSGLISASAFRHLRVAVLSTGNELTEPGSAAGSTDIFDANRPMLKEMVMRWGGEVVDLGIAGDTRVAIRDKLNDGAADADVILTSGGASAGDEDHIASLLQEGGTLNTWRIAVKPGRPLALGLWHGKPVFGLPGNPVAAFVCAAIFVRPALSVMAGAGWATPLGFDVPAGFAKSKKPGRREYLRARLNASGQVEVFHTEGSGRVSGLSWADGLVELPDGAAEITPGTPVRYIPFSGLGL